MHDDLIINELFVSDIRGTSSDAYYISPYNLDGSTDTGFRPDCGWSTNGLIDAWLNTDKILKVVRQFMVPRDIDDGSFTERDECNTGSDITNLFLEE